MDTTIQITTGAALRAEREQAELTQAELAERMGSTQQHLSVIESRAIVRPKTARRFLDAVYGYTASKQAAS